MPVDTSNQALNFTIKIANDLGDINRNVQSLNSGMSGVISTLNRGFESVNRSVLDIVNILKANPGVVVPGIGAVDIDSSKRAHVEYYNSTTDAAVRGLRKTKEEMQNVREEGEKTASIFSKLGELASKFSSAVAASSFNILKESFGNEQSLSLATQRIRGEFTGEEYLKYRQQVTPMITEGLYGSENTAVGTYVNMMKGPYGVKDEKLLRKLGALSGKFSFLTDDTISPVAASSLGAFMTNEATNIFGSGDEGVAGFDRLLSGILALSSETKYGIGTQTEAFSVLTSDTSQQMLQLMMRNGLSPTLASEQLLTLMGTGRLLSRYGFDQGSLVSAYSQFQLSPAKSGLISSIMANNGVDAGMQQRFMSGFSQGAGAGDFSKSVIDVLTSDIPYEAKRQLLTEFGNLGLSGGNISAALAQMSTPNAKDNLNKGFSTVLNTINNDSDTVERRISEINKSDATQKRRAEAEVSAARYAFAGKLHEAVTELGEFSKIIQFIREEVPGGNAAVAIGNEVFGGFGGLLTVGASVLGYRSLSKRLNSMKDVLSKGGRYPSSAAPAAANAGLGGLPRVLGPIGLGLTAYDIYGEATDDRPMGNFETLGAGLGALIGGTAGLIAGSPTGPGALLSGAYGASWGYLGGKHGGAWLDSLFGSDSNSSTGVSSQERSPTGILEELSMQSALMREWRISWEASLSRDARDRVHSLGLWNAESEPGVATNDRLLSLTNVDSPQQGNPQDVRIANTEDVANAIYNRQILERNLEQYPSYDTPGGSDHFLSKSLNNRNITGSSSYILKW